MTTETELRTMLRHLWQTACQDTPARPSCVVEDGQFRMSITGNRDNWALLHQLAGVPSHAVETIHGDTITWLWPSHADQIFGVDGRLAAILTNYEPRPGQLHMARLVQRSFEMNEPAIIEAGTGVGKSFAYLAIALAMSKRAIVATSNKALQMQLYRKDAPFLIDRLFPGRTVTVAVGKANYMCRFKCEDIIGGGIAITDPALAAWYDDTETGNTEEIPFAVDKLHEWTADEDCAAKHCAFYDSCFYYAAKARRKEADIVITNHMLLAMHQMYPGAGILPDADVVIVDEAHQLPSYARNALQFELHPKRLERSINRLTKYADTTDAQAHADDLTLALARLQGSEEFQAPIAAHVEIPSGLALAETLAEMAETIWPDGQMPNCADERRQSNAANRARTLAANVKALSSPTQPGFVRWLNVRDESAVVAPYDVSEFIGAMAGFRQGQPMEQPDHTRCGRCGRKLTAETVNVLAGHPYGPDCIHKVDPFGDAEPMLLAEWLAQEHPERIAGTERIDRTPIIFTSATIAAPDFAHFQRECGIPEALTMQAPSPFDYQSNAILYVPNGSAPTASSGQFAGWLVDEIYTLVSAAEGGALLLFTSYANMNYCNERLRHRLHSDKLTVLVQGELPKLELMARFREDGNAVLFATKSFFEGIDIQGEALRLVIIDKMPFAAPNPLSEAQGAALKEYARTTLKMADRDADWYPFNALAVPQMVLDLKQAFGRLIRTQTDYGVVAILDNRLRTAQYARRTVLPALPPAHTVATPYQAIDFLHQRRYAHKFQMPERPGQPRPVSLITGEDNPFDDELQQEMMAL